MAKRYCKYDQIADRHPELVLLSESPVTWLGYLTISRSPYTAVHDVQCPRVKLKLIVPNYPSLSNAQIYFGKQIAALRSGEFSQSVKKLMKSPLTVSLFLAQLQLLIDKRMHVDGKIHRTNLLTNDLQEIKAVLQYHPDVKISCSGSLDIIELSLSNVSLSLQRNNNAEIPWKIVSSDLLKIPAFKDFEKSMTSLSVTVTKFKWQVELLNKAWEQLSQIDENFWIIDPMEPNKCHMHRRIHLSQSISLIITIDPLNPTVLPAIEFVGSESEVTKQTDLFSEYILNWNQDCSVLENLKMLLSECDFPEERKSTENNDDIVSSRECGICFFATSEFDKLTDKICNNKRCMKHYHSTCLSRWLQTNAGNQVVFGHIHGICPHCKEKISCSTKQGMRVLV